MCGVSTTDVGTTDYSIYQYKCTTVKERRVTLNLTLYKDSGQDCVPSTLSYTNWTELLSYPLMDAKSVLICSSE